jgi:endonuclease-3
MARKATPPAKSLPSRKAAQSARPARRAVTKGPLDRAEADARAAAGKIKPWGKGEAEQAFRRFRAARPEPKGELEHLNPFTLLVAVVLSAQATDAGVNKATRNLFPRADTPEKMLALGEARVREAIKSLGFFNVKSKNVIALAQRLVNEHGGQVPHTREALEALPGVGRKTANVVLNVAFGEPTIAVDTHVFRVANRTGLAPGKTPLEVEMRLLEVVPPKYLQHAHHWLILHGRYICKAMRPLCEQCLINDLCRWPGKVTPAAPPTR